MGRHPEACKEHDVTAGWFRVMHKDIFSPELIYKRMKLNLT